ncbi:MAG: hypothetical protein JO185_08845 [Acidobacteriaceae bacterium]|nr:hypothetical protein [Acidobacteriaceae bacterium]
MQRLYQKTITITIKILSSSLFVPLAFLTPLATRAATITIKTTCQPAQQRAFTTNNGCSVPASPPTSSYNTGGGAVSATGSASFTLAANAADWNTLRVYAETVANPLDASTPVQSTLFYNTEGLSHVTVSTTLTTAGPVRPGFVRIEAFDAGIHAAGVDGNSGDLTFASLGG